MHCYRSFFPDWIFSVNALIQVKDVVNRFGNQVVHDGVNMTLEKGEILGLVGGSGSGKSVLLRTILGLNKPQNGRVLVFGKDIHALPDENKKELQRKAQFVQVFSSYLQESKPRPDVNCAAKESKPAELSLVNS